jgi:hypothetical protein
MDDDESCVERAAAAAVVEEPTLVIEEEVMQKAAEQFSDADEESIGSGLVAVHLSVKAVESQMSMVTAGEDCKVAGHADRAVILVAGAAELVDEDVAEAGAAFGASSIAAMTVDIVSTQEGQPDSAVEAGIMTTDNAIKGLSADYYDYSEAGDVVLSVGEQTGTTDDDVGEDGSVAKTMVLDIGSTCDNEVEAAMLALVQAAAESAVSDSQLESAVLQAPTSDVKGRSAVCLDDAVGISSGPMQQASARNADDDNFRRLDEHGSAHSAVVPQGQLPISHTVIAETLAGPGKARSRREQLDGTVEVESDSPLPVSSTSCDRVTVTQQETEYSHLFHGDGAAASAASAHGQNGAASAHGQKGAASAATIADESVTVTAVPEGLTQAELQLQAEGLTQAELQLQAEINMLVGKVR